MRFTVTDVRITDSGGYAFTAVYQSQIPPTFNADGTTTLNDPLTECRINGSGPGASIVQVGDTLTLSKP